MEDSQVFLLPIPFTQLSMFEMLPWDMLMHLKNLTPKERDISFLDSRYKMIKFLAFSENSMVQKVITSPANLLMLKEFKKVDMVHH